MMQYLILTVFSFPVVVVYGIANNIEIMGIIGIIVFIFIFVSLIFLIMFALKMIPIYKVKLYYEGIEFRNVLTFKKVFYKQSDIKKIEKVYKRRIRFGWGVLGRGIGYTFSTADKKQFEIELYLLDENKFENHLNEIGLSVFYDKSLEKIRSQWYKPSHPDFIKIFILLVTPLLVVLYITYIMSTLN